MSGGRASVWTCRSWVFITCDCCCYTLGEKFLEIIFGITTSYVFRFSITSQSIFIIVRLPWGPRWLSEEEERLTKRINWDLSKSGGERKRIFSYRPFSETCIAGRSRDILGLFAWLWLVAGTWQKGNITSVEVKANKESESNVNEVKSK